MFAVSLKCRLGVLRRRNKGRVRAGSSEGPHCNACFPLAGQEEKKNSTVCVCSLTLSVHWQGLGGNRIILLFLHVVCFSEVFSIFLFYPSAYSKAGLGARAELFLPWERRWGASGPRRSVRQSWGLSPRAPSSSERVGRTRKWGG